MDTQHKRHQFVLVDCNPQTSLSLPRPIFLSTWTSIGCSSPAFNVVHSIRPGPSLTPPVLPQTKMPWNHQFSMITWYCPRNKQAARPLSLSLSLLLSLSLSPTLPASTSLSRSFSNSVARFPRLAPHAEFCFTNSLDPIYDHSSRPCPTHRAPSIPLSLRTFCRALRMSIDVDVALPPHMHCHQKAYLSVRNPQFKTFIISNNCVDYHT
jgi:hypothetical protein